MDMAVVGFELTLLAKQSLRGVGRDVENSPVVRSSFLQSSAHTTSTTTSTCVEPSSRGRCTRRFERLSLRRRRGRVC